MQSISSVQELNNKEQKKDLSISVVIPTYKDWDRLVLCLKALEQQTLPKEQFEVIVVNNEPKDLCPLKDLALNVQVIEESAPGSYAARNTGVTQAGAEVIAFTDADCIPEAHWLAEGLKLMQSGEQRVAGHIVLTSDSEKPSAAEVYSKAFAFDQIKRVKKGVAVTANLFIRKEVYNKVGPFNPELMSGGDFEWNKRATAMGFGIVYSDKAIVEHPALKTMAELFKKERRIAGGVVMQKKMRGEKVSMLSMVRNFLPPLQVLHRLLKRKDLTKKEALTAFGVHYLLNTYKQYVKFLIYIGLHKTPRT